MCVEDVMGFNMEGFFFSYNRLTDCLFSKDNKKRKEIKNMGNTIKTCTSKEEYCTTFHGKYFPLKNHHAVFDIIVTFLGTQ